MIKSLLAKNYQSHKETSLVFHKGVNVIVGSSDTGKTAIVRVLRWIINNLPLGDSFRRTGTKETEAVLTIDKTEVSRLKTASRNEYRLGSGDPFKAFGQDVPEEIKKILNMSSINTQYQLDRHFLLSETSGEVAKVLNKAVNLDIIDTTVSNINAKVRDNEQSSKVEKALKEKLSEDLEAYDYLEQMEKDVAALESIEAALNCMSGDADEIVGILAEVAQIVVEQDEVKALTGLEEDVDALIKNCKQLHDATADYNDLEGIILTLEIIDTERELFKERISHEAEVDRLLDLDAKIDGVVEAHSALYELMRDMERADTDLFNKGQELKVLQDEFDEMMPNECPFGLGECKNK